MKELISVEKEISMSSLDFLNNIINPSRVEAGEWLYFAPADVKRVQFTPVPAEQAENPEEEMTK